MNYAFNQDIVQDTSFPKNERIVIFIKIGGGNDDYNCRAPINGLKDGQDVDLATRYSTLRPGLGGWSKTSANLVDSTTAPFAIADNQAFWVHPDMAAYRRLLLQGWGHTVNAVSYGHRTNMSHFASDDIIASGGWSEVIRTDGWIGRFLAHLHPSYPDGYPSATNPLPLGLETQSLIGKFFNKDGTLPLGAAITDPVAYYNEVIGLESGIVGKIPAYLETTPYGQGLLNLSKSLNNNLFYAQEIKNAYEAGGLSTVTYPKTFTRDEGVKDNRLSPQLETIAKLIAGQHGNPAATRVYMARHGGFDNHANQATTHPSIIYHWFESIEAFLCDMWNRGLFNKVLVVCHTEFGRRPMQNGTGTDHGSCHPMHIFGPVNGGITGTNPLVGAANAQWAEDVDGQGNPFTQYDYRDVLARVLTKWMDAPAAAVAAAKFDQQTLTTPEKNYYSTETFGLENL